MNMCFVPTSDGFSIAVRIDCVTTAPNTPIALIAHGLAGYKEEPHLRHVADVFIKNGFRVISFDARFGLGETGGDLQKACFTNFIADLNTVIKWVKSQDFGHAPLTLVGHSLGAGACFDFAVHHPESVAHVISLSAVYNGRLLLESYQKFKPNFVVQWQKEKLLYRAHPDFPERNGYISYDHMIDAFNYELEKQANRITCPVTLIYGDRDISSTESINHAFFDALTTQKQLICISNCGHTYSKPDNLTDLQNAIQSAIDFIR